MCGPYARAHWVPVCAGFVFSRASSAHGLRVLTGFCRVCHDALVAGTLADRLLEVTGTVSMRDMKDQYMDTNAIERDRGITM